MSSYHILIYSYLQDDPFRVEGLGPALFQTLNLPEPRSSAEPDHRRALDLLVVVCTQVIGNPNRRLYVDSSTPAAAIRADIQRVDKQA